MLSLRLNLFHTLQPFFSYHSTFTTCTIIYYLRTWFLHITGKCIYHETGSNALLIFGKDSLNLLAKTGKSNWCDPTL